MNIHATINIIKPKKHYFCEVTMNAMKNDLTPNPKLQTYYAGFHLSFVIRNFSFVISSQRTTGWDAMFTFSGKERDQETGYSYFGARYYDSDLSIWLSVDPLAHLYPSHSSYNYCMNNPIRLMDPDGRKVVIPGEEDQAFVNNLIDPESKDYSPEFHDKYKKLDESDHIYTFESWEYDASRGENGQFINVDEKNSTIKFTKDNPNVHDIDMGESKYRVLFEEVFHGAEFDKTRTVEKSCYSEAKAWQFSTLAPGTSLSYLSESGSNKGTYMGRLRNSSLMQIAFEFKFGTTDNKKYATISGAPYKSFPLFSKSELNTLFSPKIRGY